MCQSLLVNLNSIQENYILLYLLICYEIIIVISFITYLYYNSKYKIENEKHKELFKELNELNKKYEMEIEKNTPKRRKHKRKENLKLDIKNIKTLPNKSKLSQNNKESNIRKYYSDIFDYRNNNSICIDKIITERNNMNKLNNKNSINDKKVLRTVTV
jgi:hypothetical protein